MRRTSDIRHVSLHLHPSQDPRHEMVPTLVNISGMDRHMLK